MSKDNYGDFLERMERNLLKRNDDEQRRLSQPKLDEACTFQPMLSMKSEQMRARSSYEMSRGDLLRKETSQRMLKLRVEQEEMADMTFQPEISKKAQLKESTLKLQEDPSHHLEWHQQRLAKMEAMREAAAREKEEQALAQCTFQPETRECPAYMTRIARSMAMIKKARANNNQERQTKPLWK